MVTEIVNPVGLHDTAANIARCLDRDPIMARLVKEHISPARLLEVLELPADDVIHWTVCEAPDSVR